MKAASEVVEASLPGKQTRPASSVRLPAIYDWLVQVKCSNAGHGMRDWS
jgi:hypothetical protein